jgi:hypothetical protein
VDGRVMLNVSTTIRFSDYSIYFALFLIVSFSFFLHIFRDDLYFWDNNYHHRMRVELVELQDACLLMSGVSRSRINTYLNCDEAKKQLQITGGQLMPAGRISFDVPTVHRVVRVSRYVSYDAYERMKSEGSVFIARQTASNHWFTADQETVVLDYENQRNPKTVVIPAMLMLYVLAFAFLIFKLIQGARRGA